MHLARAAVRGSLRPLGLHQQRRQCRPTIIQQHFSALVSSQQWDSNDDDTQFMARHPNPDSHAHITSMNRRRPLDNHHFQHAQVRFRRHDRASAFSKPRPHTKKQRSEYNRKLKKWQDEKDKHSAPGSQAGPHRQWMRERRQELLDKGTENEVIDPSWLQQYGYGDALLDDLVGNTSHLTSQPTPEPAHLGHQHKRFYDKVAHQMDRYRESIEALRSTTSRSEISNNNEILDPTTVVAKLPSETAIANVLRAYRDRHGTRNKPIGIAMALQHLLQDLKVPTVAFGEHTYTALLTCCRTPNEVRKDTVLLCAMRNSSSLLTSSLLTFLSRLRFFCFMTDFLTQARRIFKLMNDNQHPISSYSWSILVDVHSKVADFQGCGKVIKEMVSEGVPPTQAAYTSLLAACYKVCSDGRIAHSVRSKAGELGWKQWQEMRIIGIDPDAMAYGAMIRLCAARGRPERAMNLLQEMQRFDVKPTTLCFSSALRAVAKSHEIAIRFERGSSRKQLRRESFAAHHGQMARQIVILAENAEVEIDEGFTSALMLCAAAAGDSATAKAVYLASEVRKMDQLRTVGPESHLKRLRGDPESETDETALMGLGSDSKPALVADSSNNGETAVALANNSSFPAPYSQEKNLQPTYGEREYGKDTRALSALLKACANAVNSNGIGTIWAGKQNQGYLCENSLRLITTRWEPAYTDNSIPGVNTTKLGISALRKSPQDERERIQKPGTRVKFQGLFMDESVAMTVDDLDEDYTKIVENENDGRGKAQGEDDVDDFIDVAGRRARSESFNLTDNAVQESVAFASVSDLEPFEAEEDAFESTPQFVETKHDKQEEEEELYFDKNARRWKSRPKVVETKQETDELTTDFETQRLNDLRSGGAKTEQSLTFEVRYGR
jgi:pentatricopeptide repeat protein